MFVDLNIADITVLLCGSQVRTARVAEKFDDAAVQLFAADEAELAGLGADTLTGVGLAVVCAGSDSALPWKIALTDIGLTCPMIVDGEEPPGQVGTVFLIGAGPGDPGLMTRHSLEALAVCDVVLLDHLAPHQELKRWAPRARVIDVGKIPGQHRVPQSEIDALMVKYALEGKNVARLKGGDPYVFGRGAEELYVCEQRGIPVKVFSGVTSSIALPAMAGVPLTLRGVSHMFTVVSAHVPLADSELNQLAGLLKDGGTVSILMGVKTLRYTVAGLLERGVRPEIPMVTVQDGFRENQREIFSTLGKCLRDYSDVLPPAVITIGDVCAAVGHGKKPLMEKAFQTH